MSRVTRTNQSHVADWLHEARIGAFIHFLPDVGHGPRAVAGFDPEALARQLEDIGARYFVFTLSQNSGWINSPNAAYDRLAGFRPGERRLQGERDDDVRPGALEGVERRPLGGPRNALLRHDDGPVALETPIDEVRHRGHGEGVERSCAHAQRIRLRAEFIDPLELRIGPRAELRDEGRLPEGTPGQESEPERQEHRHDGDDVVPERDHAGPPSWKIHWRMSSTSCIAQRRSGGDTMTTASIAKSAAPTRSTASRRRTRGA